MMKAKVKRMLSLLLSICLLAAYTGGMASASEDDLSLEVRAAGLSSSADLPDGAVRKGDHLAVTVSLRSRSTESYPAVGLEFTLSFDAERLDAEENQFQNYMGSDWDFDYDESRAVIHVLFTGNSTVELVDGMDLASFAFQVKDGAEEGEAAFSMEATVFDNEGSQLSIPSQNCSVEILSPEPEKQELAAVTLETSSVIVNGNDDIEPIQATASDVDGKIVSEHLVWTVEPEDSGVEIDAETGLITVTSSAEQDEYTVTVKVADGQDILIGEASAKLSVQRESSVYTVTFHQDKRMN